MFTPPHTPIWFEAPQDGPAALYPPRMSWQDIEVVLEDLGPTPQSRDAAVAMVRALRAESIHLSPMDLLQQILLTAAAIREGSTLQTRPLPPQADTLLPRWAYDDLETAIYYSTSGACRRRLMALAPRLLTQAHTLTSGIETARAIASTFFAVPWKAMSARRAETTSQRPRDG